MLFDIADPCDVRVERIDRHANQLHAQVVETLPSLCESDELGGTDRREIGGMREEQHVLALRGVIAETDDALGGFGFKIRGGLKDAGNSAFLNDAHTLISST